MLASNELILSLALKSGIPDKIEKAFEKIYNDYAKLVSFCVAKFVDDNEVIKDITQDVFLSFFENADKVKVKIKPYLCSCAKNKAIDYLKKEKHIIYTDDLSMFDGTIEVNSAQFYKEIMDDIKLVLDKREVQVVELHIVSGYSFKDIGNLLNITSNNANMIYYRALKKFKKSEKGKKYEKR